jgi:phosphopantothenoylcysteine decarboxylase/phosphopantothenate--cysteine ligase
VAHVSLADRADVALVAPASANIIGKMANGIADDMLSTTLLAMECPILVSPAMNVHMFENPIVQDNLKRLESYGKVIIPPDNGYLACGYTGNGKMPSEEVLLSYILREIACEKDLKGKKVLVTAGPTQEAIDPVRFVTNHSTGKMGYAIAEQAMLRGASVTLVSGPTAIAPPPFVEVIHTVSAQDMFEAVQGVYEEQDIIIKTAAVADYTPAVKQTEKIKKSDGDFQITFDRTQDILAWLGQKKKPQQVLCGFSMETEHVLENSKAKLVKKNADLIAANSLKDAGAGFGTDTNHLTLIGKEQITDLPLMTKAEAANHLLDALKEIQCNK